MTILRKNKTIFLILSLGLLISCGDKAVTQDDNRYWTDVERYNTHFTKLLTDSTYGLFEDFDVWTLTPTKRIEKYYQGLNFPIIETKLTSEGRTKLIVHRYYQCSDTINLSFENNIPIMSRNTYCYGTYSSSTGAYGSAVKFYPDKITFKADSNWCFAYLYKNGNAGLYLNDSTYFFKQTIERKKEGLDVYYETTKYIHSTDTAELGELKRDLLEYPISTDSTSWTFSDFISESDANPNWTIFTNLGEKIRTNNNTNYSSSKSEFWYIWESWLSNVSKLCRMPCC
jgi:hypothetical protein